jgi:hypothetical protein
MVGHYFWGGGVIFCFFSKIGTPPHLPRDARARVIVVPGKRCQYPNQYFRKMAQKSPDPIDSLKNQNESEQILNESFRYPLELGSMANPKNDTHAMKRAKPIVPIAGRIATS